MAGTLQAKWEQKKSGGAGTVPGGFSASRGAYAARLSPPRPLYLGARDFGSSYTRRPAASFGLPTQGRVHKPRQPAGEKPLLLSRVSKLISGSPPPEPVQVLTDPIDRLYAERNRQVLRERLGKRPVVESAAGVLFGLGGEGYARERERERERERVERERERERTERERTEREQLLADREQALRDEYTREMGRLRQQAEHEARLRQESEATLDRHIQETSQREARLQLLLKDERGRCDTYAAAKRGVEAKAGELQARLSATQSETLALALEVEQMQRALAAAKHEASELRTALATARRESTSLAERVRLAEVKPSQLENRRRLREMLAGEHAPPAMAPNIETEYLRKLHQFQPLTRIELAKFRNWFDRKVVQKRLDKVRWMRSEAQRVLTAAVDELDDQLVARFMAQESSAVPPLPKASPVLADIRTKLEEALTFRSLSVGQRDGHTKQSIAYLQSDLASFKSMLVNEAALLEAQWKRHQGEVAAEEARPVQERIGRWVAARDGIYARAEQALVSLVEVSRLQQMVVDLEGWCEGEREAVSAEAEESALRLSPVRLEFGDV